MPAPVSQVQVAFPSDLGLATSGLGLAECDPAALQREGESACPADPRLGDGSATVGDAFGPSVVDEHVTLGLFAAPSDDGYIHMAIAASGLEPIDARIVMAGVLLPGRLQVTVPAVASLPGEPDVAVLSLQARLGGALSYYEHAHGKTVAYRPRGIGCPHTLRAGAGACRLGWRSRTGASAGRVRWWGARPEAPGAD